MQKFFLTGPGHQKFFLANGRGIPKGEAKGEASVWVYRKEKRHRDVGLIEGSSDYERAGMSKGEARNIFWPLLPRFRGSSEPLAHLSPLFPSAINSRTISTASSPILSQYPPGSYALPPFL